MKIRIISPSTDFEILSCKVLTLLRLYKGGISCHKEVPTHEINFNAINIYYWPTVTMLWEVLCLQRVKDTGLEFLCYLHLFTWPKPTLHTVVYTLVFISYYFSFYVHLYAWPYLYVHTCNIQFVCYVQINSFVHTSTSYVRLCLQVNTCIYVGKIMNLGVHISVHMKYLFIYIYIVYSFIRWICKAHLSRLSDSELNSR